MSDTVTASFTTSRLSARDLLDRMLDLLGAHDIDGAVALFADDVELRAPFVPAPLPSRTVGRTAVAAMMAMVFGSYGRVEFHDRRFMTTADDGVVVGRWRTDIEVLATGATYSDEVIAVVEVRDGSVVRFTEYFNPDALRAAGVVPPAS
ncbi:MAG: nuclear transport factor 2 family protein [Ilumatobacteraceae bacterium]